MLHLLSRGWWRRPSAAGRERRSVTVHGGEEEAERSAESGELHYKEGFGEFRAQFITGWEFNSKWNFTFYTVFLFFLSLFLLKHNLTTQ